MPWTKLVLGLLMIAGLPSELRSQSSEITKDFQYERASKRASTDQAMSRLTPNRNLARGLASGVTSLNRTVDSLLESLFYGLMDQELRHDISDDAALVANYRRDVHPTGLGQYVVTDTFRLGPNFLKELGKIRGLPVTFQNQTQLFITNTSLRSDALRRAEADRNPFWRELLSNWFGALPLLTRVLPPSFNPEELHDPVGYLQTPFLFPRNVEEALAMPIGTVRSYGLAGTTSLAIDLKGRTFTEWQKKLQLADLDLRLPLSLFHEGEHRISILRRTQDEVWLALSELRRLGQGLGTDLGKTYQAFQTVFGWWSGVPAPIAPVDFELQKARNIRIDELYSFDLREALAQVAFTDALRGKLSKARDFSGQNPQSRIAPGVRFHFRRLSTRRETNLQKGHSFYVAQSQRDDQIGLGESKTVDPQGEFLTLDAEHEIEDRNWNLLVGAENLEFRHRLSIPVRKETLKGRPDRYKLDITAENPLYMTASLRLIDNFVDTRELHRTFKLLRIYSGMPLEELPDIPTYAADVRRELLLQQALANPMNEISQREVTPTYLGRMTAFVHIYFAHDTILQLAQKPSAELWAAFAKAFDADPQAWQEEGVDPGFSYYINLLGSYLALPLKLLNTETTYPDLVLEAKRTHQAFQKVLKAREALDLQNAYQELLDTSHPVIFLQALHELAKGLALPVLVGIHAEAKRSSDDTPDTRQAKDLFASLDNKVFPSEWPIPPLKRDQSVEEKLASFDPSNLRSQRPLPQLQRLTLALDRYGRKRAKDDARLLAELTVQNPPLRSDTLTAYIRVEQHGAIDLGRFVLAEQLFALKPLPLDGQAGASQHFLTYRLPLNGPDGLKDSAFFDQALSEGGAFDLIVSLSDDGEQWSAEQTLSFTIENGMLRKL
jgi:hypothetical protein